jgi:hypothetical protein
MPLYLWPLVVGAVRACESRRQRRGPDATGRAAHAKANRL